MDRTEEQVFADKLDCELFRLYARADRRGVKDKYWLKVADTIRAARTLTRSRMHAKDVKETC